LDHLDQVDHAIKGVRRGLAASSGTLEEVLRDLGLDGKDPQLTLLPVVSRLGRRR